MLRPLLRPLLWPLLRSPLDAAVQAAFALDSAVDSALDGGNGALEGLWYTNGPNTLHSPGVLSSWISTDSAATTLTLHSTIFTGADPRPTVTARGVYFNNQAGLDIANGVLPNTDQFAIVCALDLATERVTQYATKAAADAALGSHVEGDVACVTADTTTTYTPDFDKVMDGGYPEVNLVNGYYVHRAATWQSVLPYELFAFKGAGGEYAKLYLNKLGQLIFTIYAGSGSPYSVLTTATDVMALAGGHILGITKDATHLRMWWNGEEIAAVQSSALPNLTFTNFYINGDTRTATLTAPVSGWRHYVKAMAVIDDWTFTGFRGVHDAVARYAGAAVLDVPSVAWGWLGMGQSWREGSTAVTDTWRPTSGWDGQVDRVNATNSGEHTSLTREFLPRVRSTRNQDNNSDIGPLRITTTASGVLSAPDSHKAGSAEVTDWGCFKQILSAPNAANVDWTISNVYAGGNTIALLSAETPVPLVDIRTYASSAITYYEELLQAVAFAYDFHTARGQTYIAKVFFWQQGHSDTNNAGYPAAFFALYDKLNAAVKTITGQTEDLICFVPQVNYSSMGHNNRGNTGTCIDQQFLDIVDTRGARPVYCIGPMYQITSYIHAYRAAHRWIGEQLGKVIARVLDAEDWVPLQPINYTLGANYVDIEYHVPYPPMQFDDTNDNNIDGRVTFDGVDTYGYEFHSGTPATATITIASPAVVTQTAHGKTNGDKVTFDTTGALPTGLAVRTVYFVINQAANTYQLSLTSGGAAINTSGTQSGAHTAYNVNKKITAVAITDDGTADNVGVVRVTLDTLPVAGDTIKYTGRAARFGNLVDSDPATAYYRDQDWTAPLVSGSPTYAEGNLNDLRNPACASTKVLA